MTTIPNFDTATFNAGEAIDNAYFPLTPGTIQFYEGEPTDGTEETEEVIRFATTFDTRTVAGVEATVARETAWADGFLQEDTDDWFAQDSDGNVWYLGEATTSFEYDDNGNFIGTNNEGAWEAGVNGARPGYLMPADPRVGDSYYQEFAPNDAAVDEAEVIRRDRTLSTEVGRFSNVLQTFEFTELAPGLSDYKYYAPGVGLVLVEELDANRRPTFAVELESITSVSRDVFNSDRGTSTNDTLNGDDQANTLRGYRGDDFLQGFGGRDHLLGHDGNDFLVGGSDIDSLSGGRGEDILIGGRGSDGLEGGKNKDQFVFRTLDDRGDRIKDFGRQDVIVLAEIFALDSYSSSNPLDDYVRLEQRGSHTVIRIDLDGDTGSDPFRVLATLQNTTTTSLGDRNFVV